LQQSCDTITPMASGIATVIELRLSPAGLSGVITCPATLRPAPGQYLAASSPDPGSALPVILFPSRIRSREIDIAASLPSYWRIGLELDVRGPLGKGFQMPPAARRVVLASPQGAPDRLLPLAYQALENTASVAIYAQEAPAGMPAEVEMLPLDLLPEAAAWADYMALDASLSGLAHLHRWLGLAPHQRLGCPAQVLVNVSMPCCALAKCGVCSVSTRDGWARACTDGPVFDFNQFESS